MDEAKPVSTPMSSTETLFLHDGFLACDAIEYRQATVKRVLHYLKGIVDYGFFLRSHSSLALHAFVDADYVGNKDNYSSTSAYVIFLGPNLVSWSSKKQSTIARSTTKTEYRAIVSTTAKVNWLTHLLLFPQSIVIM
ncbi:uncharacterized mitochondrial protein AtMg00810-like [Aristolochia californica]|uniref:uncharacterized mitochondrial protein AtMg00810-like n=1 Tax=Aristolochia californica TaxID=171875 RepID=UPI0035E1B96C